MFKFILALSIANAAPGSYQYVASFKQPVDGVPCSLDDIQVPQSCIIHPPHKTIQGDYNVCTYLVTCRDDQ